MLFILELCMTTVERQCKVIPALTKCTQIINSLTRTMFSMLEFMCGDSDVNHKQSVRFVSTPLSLFFKWRFWYTGQTSSPFHHLLTLPFPFLWPHLPQLHCVSFFWSACALWLRFDEMQVVKADQLIAHSLVVWFLSINGGSTWRNVL